MRRGDTSERRTDAASSRLVRNYQTTRRSAIQSAWGWMKIFLGGSVFRADWSGGEPWIAQSLATGLRELGHEVAVQPGLHDTLSLVSMVSSPIDWDLVRVAKYVRSMKKFDPDVALGFYDYDSSLCRAAVRAGVPFVSAVHMYWPVCPIGTLYIEGSGVCEGAALRKCLRHMGGAVPDARLPGRLSSLPAPIALLPYMKMTARVRALRDAKEIIAISDSVARVLRSAGYTHVTVVPNGIDLREVSAQPWPASGAPILLLPATSQSERKGTQHFRDAAMSIRARRGDLRFRATNFRGDAVVEGTPFLTREQMLGEYARSFAVVAPSLWEEPFGLTAVEAMASCRPVVAYRSGALPEIVEDGKTGIVVPRGDVRALAAAMEYLADNPAVAQEMGAAGREKVERSFTRTRMIDSYLGLLKSAARMS